MQSARPYMNTKTKRTIPTNKKSSEVAGIRQDQAVVQTRQQIYEGPIPPPVILREFDQIVSGSAKQIMDMAHAESEHRRKLEIAATQANIDAQQKQLAINKYQSEAIFKSDRFGQIAGLVVSVSCVVGAVYLGFHDKQIVAVALAAIPTAAVIKAFFSEKEKK